MTEEKNIIAISVKNLTKVYRLFDSPKDRLKESLHPFRKKYHRDFYALKDVSFDVKRGETIGIIGRNGSGKSTLLKLLSGVLTPSGGTCKLCGKVSSLLELGTGFNPELTGLENVFFNGTILGLTKKEIDNKFEEIVSFADIGEFIHQPVKTYSSGMYVRLAFSVAINVNPDVLIVDEALAVGDAAFQMKCIDRINYMIGSGVTLVFVSHDPGAVKKLCKKVVLLEKGNVLKEGLPEEVFDLYNAMLSDEYLSHTITRELESGKVQTISGSMEASISGVSMYNNAGLATNTFDVGEKVILKVHVSVKEDLSKLVFGFMIRDRLGQPMFGTNTYHTSQILEKLRSGNHVEFLVHFDMNLGAGDYSISLALTKNDTHLEKNYEWIDYAMIFKVANIRQVTFVGCNWIPTEFNILIE